MSERALDRLKQLPLPLGDYYAFIILTFAYLQWKHYKSNSVSSLGGTHKINVYLHLYRKLLIDVVYSASTKNPLPSGIRREVQGIPRAKNFRRATPMTKVLKDYSKDQGNLQFFPSYKYDTGRLEESESGPFSDNKRLSGAFLRS